MPLERNLEPLGRLLERLGHLLEPTWDLLGASWAQLGSSWAPLGLNLEPLAQLELHFVLQTGLQAQLGLHFGLPSALLMQQNLHFANGAPAVFSFVLPEGLPGAAILHLYHPKGCQLQLYCVASALRRPWISTGAG